MRIFKLASITSASLLAFSAISARAGNEPIVDTGGDKTAITTSDTGNFTRFPFHISASVRGGYDDNVNTTQDNRDGSVFTNASVGLTYNFGSPRTQFSLGAGAGVTYYFDDVGGDSTDENFFLSLSLTHKATPRLTLSVVSFTTYQSQPDFTLALGINRRSGNFFYTSDKFTVAYLWTPRFSTATSYTFGGVRYDDGAIGMFEDRVENTIGNEFRYLIWPTTSLVAEYRFEVVTYDSSNRDSTTHFFLAGLDHSFNSRFSTSLRAGVEYRNYDDSSIGNDSSPYFEGTVKYALGRRTSLTWTNRYGFEESDVAINQRRQSFRTGLAVQHQFTPRISASLASFYQHDNYDSVNTPTVISDGFAEDSFDIALTARYAITRYFAVEAGYNHTEVTSDDFFREYSRNRYFAGLNFSF